MIRGDAFYDRRWPCCVSSVLRPCRLLILADSRGVVQSRLRHSGRKSLASTIVSFMAPSGPEGISFDRSAV
jgi:hypothetical protein